MLPARERHSQLGLMAGGMLLVLASLACGGLMDSLNPEPTATPVPPPTAAPTTAPTAVPEEPAESAAVINADNAATLTESFYFYVTEDSPLLAVSASPTSHEVATFGFDRVVRIYDGDTGEIIRQMTGHADFGYGLEYSPDGTKLASGAGFYTILWDAANGSKLAETQVNAIVFRLGWSPDGQNIAIVGENSSSVQLLNGANGALGESFGNPAGNVLWAVDYSPDGSLIAVGEGNGRLIVFEPDTTDIVFDDRSVQTTATWDVEFSRDGAYMASCHSSSGDITMWDTSSWALVFFQDAAHAGGCLDGTFSKNSDVYFTGGQDGRFIAWNIADGSQITSLQAPNAIWSVSASGDGELIAVAIDDGSLSIVTLP